MSLLSKSEIQFLQGHKKVSKSFPETSLTGFGQVNGEQKEEIHLTDFGKKADIANSPKNNPGHEKITSSVTINYITARKTYIKRGSVA
jgi:hypothetical protein